jgi:hypothetical protein
MKSMVANAVLIVFGLAVGLGLSEIGYRIYLADSVPERFSRPEPTSIAVYDKNHWEYSEPYGYGYPAGVTLNLTSIVDRKVVSCSHIDTINERGNIGPIEGTYEDAAIRVLVFGDSWSAFVQDGVTWTDVFERRLQERLGREVEVVNFSRDGYGVLQMFDMAADLVPEWKPDLAIIAFITNDLQRVRTWRIPLYVDGVVDRVVTSFEPDLEPDLTTSYDTFIVHHEATRDWCEAARQSGETDSVIEQIIEKYRRANRVGGLKPADLFTFSHSYLLNRVRRGDPFHGVPGWFSFPVVMYDDYREDARFMRAVASVRESGVPTILYHMAFYPEVKAGEEYIVTEREGNLLKSLYDITDFPVVETLDHVDLPVESPERMNASPNNYHPSRWGMDFYTDALLHALLEERVADVPVLNAAPED